MKILKIETRINNNKILTAINTEGYEKNNISHQFEILGVLENIKSIIHERLKRLAEKEY